MGFENFSHFRKLPVDKWRFGCYYKQAFDESNAKYARVVELADSLDSGSSAHSGRAGSSPASRTKKKKDIRKDVLFLFGAVK